MGIYLFICYLNLEFVENTSSAHHATWEQGPRFIKLDISKVHPHILKFAE